MQRCRRSRPIRFVVGALFVYLTFMLFAWVGVDDDDDRRKRQWMRKDSHSFVMPDAGDNIAPAGELHQPVVEWPDPDELGFQDAEREHQSKQRIEDARGLQEEDGRLRDAEHVTPLLQDVISTKSPAPVYSLSGSVSARYAAAFEKIKPAVDQGLIVVKWNIDKEQPAVPGGPGENGEAVVIDKDKLSPEERSKFDVGWQNNAFNQYASDITSLHRSLPDVRDAACKTLKYRDELPSTSVIVIFHNEAWSVLLRTVHSVLDRSPPHLVKEVILVDDFSSHAHLKQPLDDYMEKLIKVRVVRNKKREGLIRARLLGASVATGEVLVFLDSHCECTMGWLEPLLDRIAENRSNVVTPVIDNLNDDNLRYDTFNAKATFVGGFDWNLLFNWNTIPEREQKRRKSDVDPVWSPTMAGGLFAINREYFEYLGAYDPGMDIWGGENLELSFRVWMCGGVLETVVCSHVGHIYRKHSPYTWGTGVNVLKKNSIRLAEVWMDEYAKYYYERINNDLGEYGDVSARKELRKRLQCKSFDWYLKNVYPELFIPGDALASGEIRNKEMGLFDGNSSHPACIDSQVDIYARNKPVNIWPCHNQGGNQLWMLSSSGEILRDQGCIDYSGAFAMIYKCHGMKGNQEWIYGPDNSLRHRNTNLCLEITEDRTKLDMKPCTGIDRQIWYWKRKSDSSAVNQSVTLQPGHAK